MRRRLTIAAIAAVALAGVWFAAHLFTRPPAASAAEQEVAARFLDQVRAGQADAAWAAASAEFKSFMGRDEFRKFVRRHPALKAPADFQELRTVAPHGTPVAEYVFRTKDGKAVIRVGLGYEAGAWKVERLVAEPAG